MAKWKAFFSIVVLVCPFSLFAKKLDLQDLDSVKQKSLRFLEREQFTEKDEFYERGEWPADMRSYLIPSLVGLGSPLSRSTEEPTAFVTASIINLISESYLLDPSLDSVVTIIQRALPSFQHYREGDVFFYYPMIEFKGLKLHAPKDPDYVPRKMLALALVPPDADTTSVGFTALAYADLIQHQKPISEFQLPEGTVRRLNLFRDLRRDPHPYNNYVGVKRSGAYLTWLWDETSKSSSFFKSMSDKPNKGYRIVFGRNDVDCVVNANVLRLLTFTKNQSAEGYQSSCNHLNTMIKQGKTKQCGIYYPNTFIPLYATSNAYKAGATCLNKSREIAIQFILNRQNELGYWANDEGIGREDHVQSTALAINALFNYLENEPDSSPYRPQFELALRKAIPYLLSQMRKRGDDRVYWKGEVFFSGSAMARNTLLWRSDSYTTALVLLALVKSDKYFNHEVSQ